VLHLHFTPAEVDRLRLERFHHPYPSLRAGSFRRRLFAEVARFDIVTIEVEHERGVVVANREHRSFGARSSPIPAQIN